MMRIIWFISLLFLPLVVMPGFASAQIASSLQPFTLQITPTYPKPGKPVTATITGVVVDTTQTTILWYLNGKILPSNGDKASITFIAPKNGSRERIAVVLRQTNGDIRSASKIIRPAQVILLWEGETYTPLLYHGRSLYTSGSFIRVEARPQFITSRGARVDPKTLFYTWKRNGVILSNHSGRGDTGLLVPGPAFLGTDIIEVVVTSRDGVYKGTAALQIHTDTPVIQLYQVDPLTGVHYYNGVSAKSSFSPSATLRLQVIPYFMDVKTPNDARLDYSWSIAGTPVAATSQYPSLLVLTSSSVKKIQTTGLVTIQHTKNLLQRAQKTFPVVFKKTLRNSFFGF